MSERQTNSENEEAAAAAAAIRLCMYYLGNHKDGINYVIEFVSAQNVQTNFGLSSTDCRKICSAITVEVYGAKI
uniref:BPTI/Kunitz inhibitor domain-containing protein n=1 Tax=Syphacia muris TaxID=451379 RepID=A0A0N5AX35_9BILA